VAALAGMAMVLAIQVSALADSSLSLSLYCSSLAESDQYDEAPLIAGCKQRLRVGRLLDESATSVFFKEVRAFVKSF
jgi:hypothetical protein